MLKQPDETGNEPTKVKLDIRPGSLRKFVNLWMVQPLKKLDSPAYVPNNLRGWQESGMLDALKDDMTVDHKDFKLAKELNVKGELFMDFTSKKNAKKAEEISTKHFEHYGCVSGNASRFQDVLVQTDAENGHDDSDLLSENDNEPVVRSDPDMDFAMDELQ